MSGASKSQEFPSHKLKKKFRKQTASGKPKFETHSDSDKLAHEPVVAAVLYVMQIASGCDQQLFVV